MWIPQNASVSVFETNIRIVGGFLTAYVLSGDEIFVEKAHQVATQMLPAFDTPTGLPYGYTNLATGVRILARIRPNLIIVQQLTNPVRFRCQTGTRMQCWQSSEPSIWNSCICLKLVEIQFSEKKSSGFGKFWRMPRNLMVCITHRWVWKLENSLLVTIINISWKAWKYWKCHNRLFWIGLVSIGAYSDSYYEYLLKAWIQLGDREAREMYDEAMDGFVNTGHVKVSPQSHLLYIAESQDGEIRDAVGHLACFAGGMFALGAYSDPSPAGAGNRARDLEIGSNFTNTCHESYDRTATKIGMQDTI